MFMRKRITNSGIGLDLSSGLAMVKVYESTAPGFCWVNVEQPGVKDLFAKL